MIFKGAPGAGKTVLHADILMEMENIPKYYRVLVPALGEHLRPLLGK